MQITLLLVLHVSVYLAGNVVPVIEGQAQSYPTGLRDDEDFASPGSGSGSEPPAVEPSVQNSGSEPIEFTTKAPGTAQSKRPEDGIGTAAVSSTTPSWWYTTPSTTSSTTSTTTTPPSTTAAKQTPIYEVFTGVNQQLPTTTSFSTQLDESCLPVSFIPTYPWPVRIYCNRESNTLRAICIAGQPPQTCYCVDPVGGNILYDVVYPNCGPVTQPRTTPTTPPPATTSMRTKPATKSTTVRLQPTTPRPVSSPKTTPTTSRPTTTTLESFKIDQETLDARAETTKSWDQGVPVIATFMGQPGLLAAIICGAVVGLLTAVLLVMFLVYRMRKKDEGSYVIEEPSKRVPLVQPYERTREYYA